jgi:homoserine kinase type II
VTDLEDARALLPRWGFPPGTAIAPITAPGTNSRTFLVRHRRRRYAMQISQFVSAAEVRAEHRILCYLRQGGLPLQVPSPMAADNGQTVIETAAGPATVCSWLPGVRPAMDSPAAFGRYGRSAGLLSTALAEVPLDAAVRDWRADPLWIWPDGLPVGLLCQELRAAGMSAGQADLIEAAAGRTGRWWPAAAGLPVQVIHGDLAPSNTLADPETGELTGLLDFEFAGAGFRVQDLVAALYNSSALDTAGWPRSAAELVRGWLSACRLEAAEVAALPELLMARSLGSVLWRAAKWRAGLAAFSEVSTRAERLKALTQDVVGGGAFASVVTAAARS